MIKYCVQSLLNCTGGDDCNNIHFQCVMSEFICMADVVITPIVIFADCLIPFVQFVTLSPGPNNKQYNQSLLSQSKHKFMADYT